MKSPRRVAARTVREGGHQAQRVCVVAARTAQEERLESLRAHRHFIAERAAPHATRTVHRGHGFRSEKKYFPLIGVSYAVVNVTPGC